VAKEDSVERKLPDIEDLFPNVVRVKHKGEPAAVSLKIMKHLEGQGVLIHKDFYLDMQDDPERVIVSFRKKKPAKAFKAAKKKVRDSEAEG
jgi:hypothetical protein